MPDPPPTVKAIKTTEKITLDGLPNEPDWGQAQPITDFFRMEPKQGGKCDFPSEVKILFDEKKL